MRFPSASRAAWAALLAGMMATAQVDSGGVVGSNPAIPGMGSAAEALKAGLDISSQVDRSEITIGDRITYEIKVVYPAEGKVELPSVLGNLGSFEVKDYQASDPKPAGNLTIQTWRLVLSTFTVGAYMIPPQLVIYLPPGAALPANPADPASWDSAAAGSKVKPLAFQTQPIEIKVVRTSPETVQDIADIAPLAELEEPKPWLLFALIALAVAAIGGFVFWRLRRKAVAVAAEKPVLPPYEEAMERLAALSPANLVRQNRARELCFELSEILRRYVSRRFGVEALESTTTEFLALVPKLPVKAELRQWLTPFCESTDAVKFASAPLLESEAEDLTARLKDFVRQTRPVEPPEGAKPDYPAKKPEGARKAGSA